MSAGTQALEPLPSSANFLDYKQGVESEVKLPGLELVSTWDTGTAGIGLIYYAMRLAPRSFFFTKTFSCFFFLIKIFIY